TGRAEVVARSSPTRWAAWSFSTTDMPESARGEIQGFAERLLDQVERRAIRCIDLPAASQARWTCEIREYPIAGANDFLSRRRETIGAERVRQLAQDPEKNAFERQRPHLGGGGVGGEMGWPLRELGGQLDRESQQLPLTGP